jgi:hypothetical protein
MGSTRRPTPGPRTPRLDAPPKAAASAPGAARLSAAVVIGGGIAANVALTWGRWGDVVTDVGRELDTALQLAQGRRLYQDVRYYYGPLAPYVDAALFRLFGARVEVLAAAGLVAGTLLAVLAYRSVRLFRGRAPAGAAALLVLQANVFVQLYANNIFNFVVPYSTAATYGTVLAVASVLFLMRHILDGRRRDLWAATVLLGIVALSKLEPLFACAAAHAAAVVGLLASRRRTPRSLAPPYLASLAGAAFVYVYFYMRAGTALLADNLFLKSNATAGGYALRHSGLLEWRTSLVHILISAGCLAACVFVGALAGRAATARPATRTAHAAVTAAAAVTTGLVLAVGVDDQLRVVPFALLVAGGQVLARARRGGGLAPRDLAGLTLIAFGLGGLVRIFFNVSAAHYGFYLLVPALLAFAVWLCSPRPGAFPMGSPATVLGCAWLLAGAASHALETDATARRIYGGRDPVRVGGPRGELPVPIPYVGTVDEAVRFLEAQPPGARVLVVPHGVGITFLAGLQNVWGVHALLPPDVGGGYDDARLVSDLARHPPDLVVVTSADTSEYGKRGFGLDYAVALWQWIDARYAPLRQWRSPYYQVTILGPRR